MATAADITVKKADGTTNIVWSLISASGGDKSPALWRSNTAVGVVGQKPTFAVTSRWNTEGTVRRLDVTGSFPSVYTDSTTTLTSIRSKSTFTASFAFPQDMAAVDVSEAAAQIPNLVASALLVASYTSGFAPT